MFFSGLAFAGWTNSLNSTPAYISNINKITLKNGIFDELFLTKNTKGTYSPTIPKVWDFDTIIHALFNGDLFGGNSKFTAETVTNFRIKRRKKNTYNWITLMDIPISDEADMNSIQYDNLNASDTEYEYGLTAVCNDIEGSTDVTSVLSNFEGMYILDKDQAYHAFVNINYPNPIRRKQYGLIPVMDRAYPFVINNNIQNYEEGSIQATFVQESTDFPETACLDFKNGHRYRKDVYDFINNGKVKVIKYDDGRMYLVAITGDISESFDHPQNVVTLFNFTTLGDCDSQTDLYNAGLLDLDGE